MSHPQTRPNQSTGPHAARHMPRQTGIHRHEDPPRHAAQNYRDTHLDKCSQEHTATHTRSHTKRRKHTERHNRRASHKLHHGAHQQHSTHVQVSPAHAHSAHSQHTSSLSFAIHLPLNRDLDLGRAELTHSHMLPAVLCPFPHISQACLQNPPAQSGYRRTVSLGLTSLPI